MMVPKLRFNKITKHYGSLAANHEISFDVISGTIHGIVGENGAGKSTLMRILFGLETKDSGSIELDGRTLEIRTPQQAIAHKIGMVHQHFMLVETLTGWENIALDSTLPMAKPNCSQILQKLQTLASRFAFSVPLETPVTDMGVGHRQQLEILKCLYRDAQILILDEPTAVLTPVEAEHLFLRLKELVREGKTVLLISHKLDELLRLTDRLTVLRSGKSVETLETSQLEGKKEKLAQLIIGKQRTPPSRPLPLSSASSSLRIKNLRFRNLHLELEVQSGEILGIAGIEGNGQSELIECLLGLHSSARGEIWLGAQELSHLSVRERHELGLSVIPSDRLREAVVRGFSARLNLILGHQRSQTFSRFGWLLNDRITKAAESAMETYDIRPRQTETALKRFSGGNQQKWVIARELLRPLKCLIAAHPTRGVDIGAADFIRSELLKTAQQGAAVLWISSDLEEILQVSHRIAVLYQGKIVGISEPNKLSEEKLGLWLTGST